MALSSAIDVRVDSYALILTVEGRGPPVCIGSRRESAWTRMRRFSLWRAGTRPALENRANEPERQPAEGDLVIDV